MKSTHRIAIMTVFLSMLLISGCGLFGGEDDLSVKDLASTSVAETLEAMHAVETIAAMTLAAETTDTPTPEPTATVEPTSTDTPVVAPTDPQPDQPTGTPSVPMISVSVNTNCRTGPGIIYDLISALLIGQKAEAVARSADGAYWVIRTHGGSGTCWLWGFYATAEGQTAGLPVWDPPPTPTPVATITPTVSATIPPLVRTLRLITPFMHGDDVTLLQQRLLALGYDEVGLADGIFGQKTGQAVKHFQTVNNLAVDGIVGQSTWEALFSSGAKGP